MDRPEPIHEDMGVMSAQTTNLLRCEACGSSDILSVSFSMQDQPVLFFHCNVCDERWWERDGVKVGLSSVIPLLPTR